MVDEVGELIASLLKKQATPLPRPRPPTAPQITPPWGEADIPLRPRFDPLDFQTEQRPDPTMTWPGLYRPGHKLYSNVPRAFAQPYKPEYTSPPIRRRPYPFDADDEKRPGHAAPERHYLKDNKGRDVIY